MTQSPTFVIEPAAVSTVPVQGSQSSFPIHRIYCVGRNYADHAREMGDDPDRQPPFFFQKNPDTIVPNGLPFPYPSLSNDVHYEVELVVALKHGGSDIARADALDCVFGYAVGFDMTRRDLQDVAKKAGRPWEVGKAFEASAPCSALVPATTSGHVTRGAIWAKVNEQMRQTGDLAQMIWAVDETIVHLSRLFALRPGDLIFTGTPSGVGPVVRGDRLSGGIEGVGDIEFDVV